MKAAYILLIIALAGILVSGVTATSIELNPTVDGYSYEQVPAPYVNYTTIRNGAGYSVSYTAAGSKVYLLSSATTDTYIRNDHPEFVFDTSVLPDGAVISSATLSVMAAATGSGKQFYGLGVPEYGITGFSPSVSGNISQYDYNNFYDTLYAANITPVNGTRNNWTLNAAAIANISKTGYSYYMVRNTWDIDNNATGPTWAASNNTTFYFYNNEAGDPNKPVLNITYTISEEATFTSDAGTDLHPPQTITFTDTSTITGITNRIWRYYDNSTLPENPCPGLTCPMWGNAKQWNNFSWSNESSPSYTWGAGNWSIELDVYNGTWYNTSAGYYFVNISAGSTGMARINGTYRFFQEDSIFYANVSDLPLMSQSDTWIAGLKRETTANTPAEGGWDPTTQVPYPAYNLSYYTNNTGSRYFLINDSISKQLLRNNNFTTTPGNQEYDYGSVGANGGFPIPDDVMTMLGGSGTDHTAIFVDVDNHLQYAMGNAAKGNNGTWYVSPTIFNGSSYCYRFSAYSNGTDNGCRWLGNKWYYSSTTPVATTARRESIPTYGMSNSGIGLYELTLQYDQVASGSVNHALWGTFHVLGPNAALWPSVGKTAVKYVRTGVLHCADPDTCPQTGAWMRLKASSYANLTSKGITGTQSKVIAKTLKDYGILLINDGSTPAISINRQVDWNNYTGTTSRWNETDMTQLKQLTLDDFEFVNVSSLMLNRYSTQANVSSEAVPVTAAFTKSKSVVRIPASVTFTDTSTGTRTAWLWVFGDGTTNSTSQNPSHQYKKPGLYTVTLRVNDNAILTATATVRVIRGGGGDYYMFTPLGAEDLMVNCEEFTYTTNREITVWEQERTDEKIAEVCYG